MTPHERGQWAEDLACNYLCQQGLQLLARNYSCQMGEIDLIMQQGEFLVFVEVRYRRSSRYGSSLESIDFRKQQHLIMAATDYLSTYSRTQPPCRFDVVAISGNPDQVQIQWLTDAFRDEESSARMRSRFF
jgi:putative endonuclease